MWKGSGIHGYEYCRMGSGVLNLLWISRGKSWLSTVYGGLLSGQVDKMVHITIFPIPFYVFRTDVAVFSKMRVIPPISARKMTSGDIKITPVNMWITMWILWISLVFTYKKRQIP